MDFLAYVEAEGLLDPTNEKHCEAMLKLAEAQRLFLEALDLLQVTAAREPREHVPAAIMIQLIEGLAERSSLESWISQQGSRRAVKALEVRLSALESRLSK